MKEKIVYTDENAYNLLRRLIRVFPFKIQVDESLLNYKGDYSLIDSTAKSLTTQGQNLLFFLFLENYGTFTQNAGKQVKEVKKLRLR